MFAQGSDETILYIYRPDRGSAVLTLSPISERTGLCVLFSTCAAVRLVVLSTPYEDRKSAKCWTVGRSQVTEKAGAERTKKRQLSEVLDAQRKRTEDAWFAATTGMQNDAWTAGRDKDRRVNTRKHEPERRRT